MLARANFFTIGAFYKLAMFVAAIFRTIVRTFIYNDLARAFHNVQEKLSTVGTI